MKIIIVGGVAGGATLATRLRRLSETDEIIIFEKTNYVSFANCGLPYYIGDVITDKRELTLQTPDSFKNRFNIDCRVNHEVIKIYPEQKKVKVKNLKTNEEFLESYDKLVLSTGAKPIYPKFSAYLDKRIFTLRNVEDTFKIKEYFESNKVSSCLVVGGGFIGLEMVENLVNLNLNVTLAQGDNQVMLPLDREMATFLNDELIKHHINLLLNHMVNDIVSVGDKLLVLFKDKPSKSFDMVILAIGVIPDTSLAKDINIDLGIKGAIKVDSNFMTSIKDIYAVGDSIEINNYVSNNQTLISLAGPATKQARVLANVLNNIEDSYQGGNGTSILKLFDLTIATTGLNEKELKKNNLEYSKIYLSPSNHASYYPNSEPLHIKVLFSKDYTILGAQIVGGNGTDKRIDLLSFAIKNKIKGYQLKDLDLAYSPCYSSSKDPINLIGMILSNLKDNLLKQCFYDDLNNLDDSNAILLDVRTKKEYLYSPTKHSINIPLDELRDNVSLLSKDKKIYIICHSGVRSYNAYRILSNLGYDCYNFSGGYIFYQAFSKLD